MTGEQLSDWLLMVNFTKVHQGSPAVFKQEHRDQDHQFCFDSRREHKHFCEFAKGKNKLCTVICCSDIGPRPNQ